MHSIVLFLMVCPALVLLAMGWVPGRMANSHPNFMRAFVTAIAGFQGIVAIGLAAAWISGALDTVNATIVRLPSEVPVVMNLYYDGVAALMFALVAFVGFVICRFSIRYLDGETTQGRYFRWVSFTIGAVSLMVISGNMLMFVGAWVLTSLGLHKLLLHYADRPAAQRAARTKFMISRIGDAALIGAVVLIYREFGTLNFADWLAAAGAVTEVTTSMNVASLLLVVGAITKSAQFPFHSWLPLTMETPTPVSALMHAGIVNAGGYLIIRASSIVSLTPVALTTLAVIGGVTACFAAMVMLTQTSVKKSLAYSTIAQMGFMILQCGLGAFSTAMLHILAHSLYKAYAFLSSGSVLAQASGMQEISGPATSRGPVVRSAGTSMLTSRPVRVLTALTVSLASIAGVFYAFGINPVEKPGGVLLGGVLCLALTHWLSQIVARGDRMLLARGVVVCIVLCSVYAASFVAVDRIVAASLPVSGAPAMVWLVVAVVLIGFSALLLTPLRQRIYIHASNGFYVENTLRRVFGPVITS